MTGLTKCRENGQFVSLSLNLGMRIFMGGFLDPGNTTPLLAVTEGRPALCNVSSGNILLFSFHICCKICTFLHFSCGLRLRGEGEGVCTC